MPEVFGRLERLIQTSGFAQCLVDLVGQGANFFLQAVFFLLLTHLLGVTEYGIFSGAYALISLATPYSTLGAGMLFMRYVVGGPLQGRTLLGQYAAVDHYRETADRADFLLCRPRDHSHPKPSDLLLYWRSPIVSSAR